ncbi:MAG: hypothetical protein V1858_01660 [Candidatus Gottesmanbacteria bacterium]
MITNTVIPDFAIGTLVSNLLSIGIIIAFILVLLYFVWGGIEWMSSGGDKAGLESARNRITNALIGLIIVVSVWAVMLLLKTFLCFPFPDIPIPSLSGVQSATGSCSSSSSSTGSSSKPLDCVLSCIKYNKLPPDVCKQECGK